MIASEIPLPLAEAEMLELMPPKAVEVLCNVVERFGNNLNSIANGDPNKEEYLAKVLFSTVMKAFSAGEKETQAANKGVVQQ